jgi:hypothetical protein
MDFLDRWRQSSSVTVDGHQWQRLLDSLAVIATLMRQVVPPADLYPALAVSSAGATSADTVLLRTADVERRVLTIKATHGFDRELKKFFIGRTTSVFDSRRLLTSPHPISVNLQTDMPSGFTAEEFRALSSSASRTCWSRRCSTAPSWSAGST